MHTQVTSYGRSADTALKKAEAKEHKADKKAVRHVSNHGHTIHIGDPL